MDIRTKFKYPTNEEIELIQHKNPRISRFGFPACFPSDFDNLEVFHRYYNLNSWDVLLHNRIADFTTCFMYVLVHLNRGLPSTSGHLVNNEQYFINYTNTNFYLGYLLFCFQAINDVILQIANLYFQCGLTEPMVTKTKIKEKLAVNYPHLSEIITAYYENIKDIVELRNSLTHRFNPLQLDNRALLVTDKKVIMPMNNEINDYDNFIEITEDSIVKLNLYIEALKLNMKIDTLNI